MGVKCIAPAPLANMAALQPEDLLGGGLDIDGWSYLKQDVEHRRCADLIDKTYVQRQQFSRVMSSQLSPEERKDVHEIVVGAIEHKATFDTKWIGRIRLFKWPALGCEHLGITPIVSIIKCFIRGVMSWIFDSTIST